MTMTQPISDEMKTAIKACCQKLERHVGGRVEQEAHPRAVARILVSVPPEVGVGVMQRLHRSPNSVESKAACIAIARLLIMERGLPYSLRESLYAIARARGYTSVAMSLLEHRPQKEVTKGFHMEAPAPEGELSLGERKWIARLHNRESLQRLARDPHPDVVRHILKNPKMVERDILLVAAARPGKKEVFELIVEHPKWLASSAVRVALCFNPYCSTRIAVCLAPTLPLKELKELSKDVNIHVVLRDVARYLVEIRTSKPEKKDG